MRELALAWPPAAAESSESVSRPSDAPYTAAEAGRSGADDNEVEDVAGDRVEGQAEMLGELARRGVAQRRDRGHDHPGNVAAAQPQVREQDVGIVHVLDVDPRVRQVRTSFDERQRVPWRPASTAIR